MKKLLLLLLLILATGCNWQNSDKKMNQQRLNEEMEESPVIYLKATSLQEASAQALVDNIFAKDNKGNYVLEERVKNKDRRIVDFTKVYKLLELMKNNIPKPIKYILLRTLYAKKNDILELLIKNKDMKLIELFTEIDTEIDFTTIKENIDEILGLIDGKIKYMTIVKKENVNIKLLDIFLATNTNRVVNKGLPSLMRVIYIFAAPFFSDEQITKWIKFVHFRGCKNMLDHNILNENIKLNNTLMKKGKIQSINALIKCGYDINVAYTDDIMVSSPEALTILSSFIKLIPHYVTIDDENNNDMHMNVKDREGLEIIRRKIRDNKSEVIALCKERNKKGLTPIDHLIALGHADILELMLKKDIVKIDQKNCLQMTPLIFSAITNQVECMKICLKYGASIEDKIVIGSNHFLESFSIPFLAAIYDSKDSMIYALEEKNQSLDDIEDGMSILSISCSNYSVNCFEKLMEMEVNVNDESNPLYHAANANYIEGAKTLIKEGANVNYEITESHSSLLIMSISRGDRPLFDMVIDRADNVDQVNIERDIVLTPIGPVMQTMKSHTPLIMAINSSNNYYIEKLLEKGADVNAKDEGFTLTFGMTPLMIAVSKNNISAITILLEQDNIDLNIKLSDRELATLQTTNKKYNLKNGQKALAIAKANSYKEAIKLIEAKMAKI